MRAMPGPVKVGVEMLSATEPGAAAPDAAVRRRWIVSRIVFGIGVGFLIVLSAGILLLAFVNMGVQGFAHNLIPIGEEPPFWTYPLLAYIGYFVLPAIVFLPILLPEALSWRDPRQIVVFRRFNTKEKNRALRRIATRHLGRFGHVFTLADRQIHRSWFVRIPALFGQLSFLHFRPRRVTTGRRLAALERLLNHRARLNLNWLVSFRKIFPIQSSDDYWRACVNALLEHADLVVMEVSDFSPAMSWEFQQCRDRQLLDRVILLADRERAGFATARIGELWPAVAPPLETVLFTYAHNQLNEPVALRQRVADICRSRGVSFTQPASLKMLASGAFTLAIGLLLAGVGIALTGPYLWPHQTARYSPIKTQVMTAYFVTGDTALLSGILATDPEWTRARLRQELGGQARSHYASNALRDIGDERDIPLLVQFLGSRRPAVNNEELGWLRWFTPTALSRRVEEESLLRLSQRLGDRALAPLVNALATVPSLSFDGSLYLEYVQGQSGRVPSATFEPLLHAPSQAGRFTAAFVLAPRGDTRTIPILLEMVRAPAPLTGATEYLRHLEGGPGLRGTWLDPYVMDDDDAAEQAARLAIKSPETDYARALVQHAPPGKGKRLMKALVEIARIGEPPFAAGAHALLARTDPAWVRSLLENDDASVRSRAVYAGAEQGVPAIVPVALSLAKATGKCDGLLGQYDCHPHEEDAVAALDRLRATMRPPQSLPAASADITGVPASAVASLIQLTATSADSAAFSRLFQSLQLATEEHQSALRSVGEQANAQTLRLIVRAMPHQAGSSRAASMLSSLAAGLIWREGINLCSIVASEHRADLMAGLRETLSGCR